MQGVHHVMHLIIPMLCLAKEGLVNRTGSTWFKLGSSELHVRGTPTILCTDLQYLLAV